MSFFVKFLSFVKIIPGGNSTAVDRIALIIWTSVSIAISAAYLIESRASIQTIRNPFTVSDLFMFSSSYLIPCLYIISVFPAVYYLVSAYPQILADNLLPNLQHPWMFFANAILYFASAIGMIVNGNKNDFSFYLAMMVITVFYTSLTLNSSFIIGICTSRIRRKMKKNGMNQKHAAEILQEFQDLKSGMSPLLFLTFTTKCIVLINMLSLIFTSSPQPIYVISTASLMMDSIFLTTVLDETYNDFKSMSLKLR
jgi:hypothetical protein